MDFYSGKDRGLPRFIYRNFADAMAPQTIPEKRADLVAQLIGFFASLQPSGDWQKMKWSLPPRVRAALTADEQAALDAVLAPKASKRNPRLLEVFPHCADEFSTDITFLDAVFGNTRHGIITQETAVLTIGSCFANNIARFLQSQSFNVTNFPLAEDLNSPFSNAKLLSVCAASDAQRNAYITHWVNTIYPHNAGLDIPAHITKEIKRLDDLRAALQHSEFIIITSGNVLDYFITSGSDGFDIGPAVAPKFLSIGQDETIDMRTFMTSKLKEAGAVFRMGNHAEVVQATQAVYQAIRDINPHAHLLFTLSPVPIDSAVGIHQSPRMGAVEMDCISKSLLRVALADRMQAWNADSKLHYFPSFEIVRWIGACMDGSIFGAEDAASRHVSQTILSGVYRYFTHKFCVEYASTNAI